MSLKSSGKLILSPHNLLMIIGWKVIGLESRKLQSLAENCHPESLAEGSAMLILVAKGRFCFLSLYVTVDSLQSINLLCWDNNFEWRLQIRRKKKKTSLNWHIVSGEKITQAEYLVGQYFYCLDKSFYILQLNYNLIYKNCKFMVKSM